VRVLLSAWIEGRAPVRGRGAVQSVAQDPAWVHQAQGSRSLTLV
jgi:hypothetical protein